MGRHKKKESIFDMATKEILQKINNAVEETTKELEFQMEMCYEKSIDYFYAQYEPSWYNRTFSTYNASDLYSDVSTIGDYYKNVVKFNESSYRAEINISDSNIHGNPYRADKDWVFERTFVKGYHGYTSNEASTWTKEIRKFNKQRRKMINKATNKTDEEKQELLKRYVDVIFRFKKGMNVRQPTPKKYFERNLTKIKRRENINQIFASKLSEQF